VYQPDAVPVPEFDASTGRRYSLLEYILRQTEQARAVVADTFHPGWNLDRGASTLHSPSCKLTSPSSRYCERSALA
jgi:hypothetical protein